MSDWKWASATATSSEITSSSRAPFLTTYPSKSYVKSVETRLTALEKAGWSLPVYHEMILGDAQKVSF